MNGEGSPEDSRPAGRSGPAAGSDRRFRLRVIRVLSVVLVVLAALAAGLVVMLRGPLLLRVGDRPVTADVSEARLRETVALLCHRYSPRSYRHKETLDAAADWITGKLEESGLEVTQQAYTLPEGTYRNVVARQAGADPALGAVIIGAHYDVCGDGPGADDNASGVAVLLELAATLPRMQTDRTRYLVAFCTEEPPFFATRDMGSYRFARHLRDTGVPVDLMVSLEMVGYFSDERGSQKFLLPGMGLLYPRKGNFIAVVGDLRSGRWIRKVKERLGATGAIPVYSFRGPSFIPGVDWSDHWGFRRLGLPGVMVTDTAFLRNPHYHQPSDAPDTLDYARMADVVRAVHGVLRD